MRYLSVCSGIEAATVAWHHMGWQPVAFSDIEPFPSAVLAHHYPHVPNLGDMTKFEEWNLESVELLVGGTPCQSFSVAGLRKGLADPRGNLMLTFLAIAQRHRPRWIVWENVPGVLSSNGGRDFGTFLGALGHLGYGWAYRVLDAQFFGVAQRRRRVFVVGYFGDWQHPAKVLFESESVCRDTPPSREAGQEVTNCLAEGTGKRPVAQQIHYRKSRRAQSVNDHETWVEDAVSNTLNCFDVGDVRSTDVVAQPVAYGIDGEQNCSEELIGTLRSHQSGGYEGARVAQPVAFEPGSIARNAGPVGESPLAPTLRREMGDNQPAVRIDMQVRRLTPVECERLQGFPDNYTNIPWRKKPESPDGPRYKALGNSMAVPVMRWIGERINKVDSE